MLEENRIAYLTSPALIAALKETRTVIIPTGSTEVMGTHGPLGADTLVADRAGADVARTTGALMAPTIPYGDALELRHWPGTVTVDVETLARLYTDVCNSLIRAGFQRFFFLNVHSPNGAAVDRCCRGLRAQGARAGSAAFWAVAVAEADGLTAVSEYAGAHGGEVATSVLLALREDDRWPEGTVCVQSATNERPKAGSEKYFANLPGGPGAFSLYGDFTDYCESGSWGDVSGASAEAGREIYRRAVDRIAEFVKEFMAL